MISVIIPVYNAQDSLKRCLDSIINTSFEDYEIILVNDGSTDNSVKLIEEYREYNSKIKLINQKNSGPSTARNVGIECAQGDVITFVDSDDYVGNNYLESIDKAFKESGADIVFFGFARVNSAGEVLSSHYLTEITGSYYDVLIDLSGRDMFGYTCIKAMKRALISEHRFDEKINLYEDEVFTCNLLDTPCKVSFLNELLYNYVRGSESLSTKVHQTYYENCELVYKQWKKLLRNEDNQNVTHFLNKRANHFAKICKYYGMEKKVKAYSFYKGLSLCEFIKDASVDDAFICAIAKKKYIYILLKCYTYRMKLRVSSLIAKIRGNK